TRRVRLILMAKLSSIKNTATCPLSLSARAFNSSSSSTTLSLVRNLIESPKKPRHCAELAAVRATASRLNRNNAKRLPSAAYALKHRRQEVGNDIELIEIH